MVVAGVLFREHLRPLNNSMYSNDAPAFVGLYMAGNINP